jgi:hypothetical protein
MSSTGQSIDDDLLLLKNAISIGIAEAQNTGGLTHVERGVPIEIDTARRVEPLGCRLDRVCHAVAISIRETDNPPGTPLCHVDLAVRA